MVRTYIFTDRQGAKYSINTPLFGRYPFDRLLGIESSSVHFNNAAQLRGEMIKRGWSPYDLTATWFCQTNAIKNNMIGWGFPNVYSLEELNGKDLILSSGNYLSIRPNRVGSAPYRGTFYKPDPDGDLEINPNFIMAADEAMTMFSSEHCGTNVNSGGELTAMAWSLESLSDPEGFSIRRTQSIFNFAYWSAGIYALEAFWSGASYENDDPLNPGGTSDSGGGDGSFTSDSDTLDFPDDPTLSAVATGMVTLFSPTNAQLASLANYLWSNDFDLDQFKKMFADPMSAIIGLSIVPVGVPTSGAVALKFGGFQTTVSMNKANGQYVTVDCGSINVNKYWGSALDYNPYTKVSIYLPYIGVHDLDVDEIMGKTITVKYKVDILSGACLAMIKCGDAVLYQYSGSCSSQIPVSNRDWSNVLSSALSLSTMAIAAATTGGASAVGTAALAVNAASATMSAKVNVAHSGSLGGASGMLGTQTPYLIIKRARQSLPEKFNTFEGYPSNITAKISTLSGFTQIEKIHLEEIPATTAELNELESILKEGIII